ncbi:MAG: hypothetical protein H0U53_00655 [Actinobacteria bacterium]|nr:hypothetical protein [Actinomycetota bacterium]
MHRRTAERAIEVLINVEYDLQYNGRPRKRPSDWKRPSAANRAGDPVQPNSPAASSFNLPTLIARNTQKFGYGGVIRKAAADAILNQSWTPDLWELDTYECDTRNLRRYCRRAMKHLQKQLDNAELRSIAI